jgi:hypothetical protein
VIKDNAPAAIASTGSYDLPIPTADDFKRAYGPVDGPAQFEQFQTSIETAQSLHGYRTMSYDDDSRRCRGRNADVDRQQGRGGKSSLRCAVDRGGIDVQGARRKILPGTSWARFPDVQKAFTDAQQDPAKFAQALTLMQTAQEKLGITQPELLPKAMVADAVQQFTDTTLPAKDRVGAIAGLLLRTQNEAQQAMIFDQMIAAKLPGYTRGAVAAMMRGDSGGATNLMRAVMIDPEGYRRSICPETSSRAISTRPFRTRYSAMGKSATWFTAITDGSTDNFQRVTEDSTLIARDVRLHLLDGTAGGNLQKAIELTTKDMYGDVQVVTGPGREDHAVHGARMPGRSASGDATTRGASLVGGLRASLLLDGVDTQFPARQAGCGRSSRRASTTT